jgi:flagellar assembly protein FliH
MSTRAMRDDWHDVARWEPPLVGPPVAAAADDAEAPHPGVPTVAELEAMERAAREDGHAAGLAEGRAAARRELEQSLARFEHLLEAAARPLQALDETTERELARLAMTVARRVVAHELRSDPTLVREAVHQAVAALPVATRALRVHLHPDDLSLLRELDVAEAHWELLPDPALTRGGCRLESESSRLDAQVETRLAAIADAVLGDDADGDDDARDGEASA